jgi:hypothetical protein
MVEDSTFLSVHELLSRSSLLADVLELLTSDRILDERPHPCKHSEGTTHEQRTTKASRKALQSC